MLLILTECRKIDIEPPHAVAEYFGFTEDPEYPLEVDAPVREWQDDSRAGVEIDLADIPDGVKTIRFYNSW